MPNLNEKLTTAAAGAANMGGVLHGARAFLSAIESRLMRHGDWARACDMVVATIEEVARQAGPPELSPAPAPLFPNLPPAPELPPEPMPIPEPS